jgi:LuxR family maltose regulon positive regulatory protein
MRLRPLLTYAFPHWACQVRIELVQVHRALGDLVGARALIAEVDDIIVRRPNLGTLVAEAKSCRALLNNDPTGSNRGASVLTDAEFRLLPWLSTHMSVPEIAKRLHLSPHTIRAEVRSIYRKLDARSRSEAVARAREQALLDA